MTLLLLLPPSETKRDGGAAGSALDLDALLHADDAAVRDARLATLAALEQLVAGDDAQAARALGVGHKIAEAELARDRALRTSPLMPALERYTGVLFDALDAPTRSAPARERAGRHVRIHSALLGLIGAEDAVPAYRLSHSSRLPGGPLKRRWAPVIGPVLERHEGPVVDLRSEGYAALGPLPARADALFVRVVAESADGAVRALNHFNKKSKGLFVRDLLEQGSVPASVEGLIAAAAGTGWTLRHGAPGELELVAREG